MACHSCKAATFNTTNDIKDSIILPSITVNQKRETHASRRAAVMTFYEQLDRRQEPDVTTRT
jgi:hypothetical protein